MIYLIKYSGAAAVYWVDLKKMVLHTMELWLGSFRNVRI